MPFIDLSILNQRQTPAFYADVLANRPAAGFVGRIFISTNTFAFFRDNGTGWDLIGGPGTGTVTGSGANGQVSFWNGASSITGTNDLFWDSVNGHLGIGTNVPGTALQIDHDQNQFIRLNQTTATNDTKIAFQNSGIALWRIGNSYNAGANDFGIYDVVGSIQPVTVKKTTGQVLIGTSTVGSGKLVVASATSDNGIQIVGATAPSLRIDSAESGPTKRIGLGLATGVNNFIQNSQNLDMCIFNGSTSAAGNMLFGIYDTGLANIQEAARISSARNFLIGTITDTGQKLQVSGTALITGELTINTSLAINRAIASSTYLIDVFNSNATNNAAYSTYRNAGVTMSIGVERSVGGAIINGGAYTGVITTVGTKDLNLATNEIIRLNLNGTTGAASFSNNVYLGGATSPVGSRNELRLNGNASGSAITMGRNGNNVALLQVDSGDNVFFENTANSATVFSTNNLERFRVTPGGNFLIGTTTDAGQKLQVNGTALFASNITITNAARPYFIALTTNANEEAGIKIQQSANSDWYIGTAQGSATPQDLSIRDVFNARVLASFKANGVINFTNVPTSAAGLVSGDIYRTANVLNIVP